VAAAAAAAATATAAAAGEFADAQCMNERIGGAVAGDEKYSIHSRCLARLNSISTRPITNQNVPLPPNND